MEVNGQGSLGRKLSTTDALNRSVSPFDIYYSDVRFNPGLPDLTYRANQGLSNYHALSILGRYRGTRNHFQWSYTWSHSVDNGGYLLGSGAYNFGFARQDTDTVTPNGFGLELLYPPQSVFSRQFDSSADRGNSDFDQRHSLVFFSIWDLPALTFSPVRFLFRNWRFSQLAAFRSGFPYNVRSFGLNLPLLTPFGGPYIYNNRADIIDQGAARVDEPAYGGRLLLNEAAFRDPPHDRLGNLGRNAFRAPGFYNLDVSLSRAVALSRLGESTRLTFRADVFSVLNHPNLNVPRTILGASDFGLASFGRLTTGPSLTPLNDTARQIQLMLRLEF